MKKILLTLALLAFSEVTVAKTCSNDERFIDDELSIKLNKKVKVEKVFLKNCLIVATVRINAITVSDIEDYIEIYDAQAILKKLKRTRDIERLFYFTNKLQVVYRDEFGKVSSRQELNL